MKRITRKIGVLLLVMVMALSNSVAAIAETNTPQAEVVDVKSGNYYRLFYQLQFADADEWLNAITEISTDSSVYAKADALDRNVRYQSYIWAVNNGTLYISDEQEEHIAFTIKAEGYKDTVVDLGTRTYDSSRGVYSYEGVTVTVLSSEYTVSFAGNGGSEVPAQVIAEGETPAAPETPVREGYTFTGWFADEELTVPYDFAAEVTGDITLYAGWKETTYKGMYKIYTWVESRGMYRPYKTGNTVESTDPVASIPTGAIAGADVTIEGETYRQIGWTVGNASYKVVRTEAGAAVGENLAADISGLASNRYLEVFAAYEKVENKSFTVRFEGNGGSETAEQVVAQGEKAAEPTVPVKEDYTFTGWFTDAELTAAYDFAAEVTGDITLYAGWKETTYKGMYKIYTWVESRGMYRPYKTGNTVESTDPVASIPTGAIAGADVTIEGETYRQIGWTVGNASYKVVRTEAGAAVGENLAADISGLASNRYLEVFAAYEKVVPASITISDEAVSMVTNSTYQLAAAVLPENTADKTVTWTSDDESVATVDENGLVTAHRYGNCVITAAAANGASASCSLTVNFYDAVVGVSDSAGNTITKNIADSINWMADAGITKGYDRVYFGSFNETSRKDFVIFLWRYAGRPEAETVKAFSDAKYAKESDTYKALAWATSEGIINGYADGTFKPNDPVTRAQVAVMLWKYADKPEAAAVSSFPDVKAGQDGLTANMVKAVNWCESAGLVKGYSSGKFQPNGKCLRFQMSIILYRYRNAFDNNN
ncbi:MAG: InlB B-repeat-containing protein [Eubacteriales bacterium]|nr:InlB B-repeat-containing protein [Eubacteriales bacterium]